MSRLKPCDRILKRRTKAIEYNGNLLEITEPSAQDYDTFLDLVSNAGLTDENLLRLNDAKLYSLLSGWITEGELPVLDAEFASVSFLLSQNLQKVTLYTATLQGNSQRQTRLTPQMRIHCG